MAHHAFRPNPAATVTLAVTATTGNVQVQTDRHARHLRVWNSGTKTAYIEFGIDNTITASATTGCPVPSGVVEIFSAPFPYVAAICGGSDTTSLYFTVGEGSIV